MLLGGTASVGRFLLSQRDFPAMHSRNKSFLFTGKGTISLHVALHIESL